MNDQDLFDAADHPAGQIKLPRATLVGRRTMALAGGPGAAATVTSITTTSSMISLGHSGDETR
ncbi:MAG TPA: hypothetical protein VJX10_01755 [Pseudonocardiaceae bacterium]|nr:hypothetical protein [Pseudonocardiaceae bacterium]